MEQISTPLVQTLTSLFKLSFKMNVSSYLTPFVGVSGLIGMITLENINTSIAIVVGLATLCYLTIKIWKELQ